MPESGGTTTQSGIYYQNSIGALYLGRLLDLGLPLDGTPRITAVRMEAPEDVDDIVVGYSDSSTLYIQAKENFSVTGDVWSKFWKAAQAQIVASTHSNDSILLVIGTISPPTNTLRETIVRARGKKNSSEWLAALNSKHRELVDALKTTLAVGEDDLLRLALRIEVKIWVLADIEADGPRNWMPPSNISQTALFSHLRDCCGGYARIRAEFEAAGLSQLLRTRFNVVLRGEFGEAIEVYRRALTEDLSYIAVPGTHISAPEADLFVMPSISPIDRSARADFDDDDQFSKARRADPKLNLRQFPTPQLRRVVLESGAGHGKTTLLRATARRLADETTFVPVLVTAESLELAKSLIDNLYENSNLSYQVSLGWDRLADSGRLVLLVDGIDEIGDNDRASLLQLVNRAAARYPRMPIVMASRDAATTVLPPSFELYRIDPLDRDQQHEMLSAYLRQRSLASAGSLMRRIMSSDLRSLFSTPLFLAIFVATFRANAAMPNSRREVLERYLEILLSPQRHKGAQSSPLTISKLRRGAQALALLALERDESSLPVEFARAKLRDVVGDDDDLCMAALFRYGVLRQRGAKVGFFIPTVQEYLAGTALAASNAFSNSLWMQKIYKRPWAQAVQFAIEQMPSIDQLVREQLTRSDDLFFTSLRLIARSIVNGATVSKDVRELVSERLLAALERTDFSTRMKIMRLIRDGFSRSPSEELKALLQDPEQDLERAAILLGAADTVLTRDCLRAVLRNPDLRELWNPDWHEAIKPFLPEAVEMLVARARDDASGSINGSVIAEVLYRFRENTNIDWSGIANDQSVPDVVRLSAQFGATFKGSFDWCVLDRAVDKQEWRLWDNFINAYTTLVGWQLHLTELCRSSDEGVRDNLWKILQGHDLDQSLINVVAAVIANISRDKETDAVTRSRLQLALARLGFEDFALTATEALKDASVLELNTWAQIAPNLEESLVYRGIEILQQRTLDQKTKLELLHILAFSIQEVPDKPASSFDGTHQSFRRRSVPHLAAPILASWIAATIPEVETIAQRSELRIALIQCGDFRVISEIIAEMERFLKSIQYVSDTDWGWLWTTLFELDNNRIKVDTNILWMIVHKAPDHPLYLVFQKIIDAEMEACFPAIERFWSESASANARSAIVHYFEENAPRLGLVVSVQNGQLSIVKA